MTDAAKIFTGPLLLERPEGMDYDIYRKLIRLQNKTISKKEHLLLERIAKIVGLTLLEFQQIVSCVRKTVPEPECWKAITFKVFDLPTSRGNFTERIKKIKQIIQQSQSTTLTMIEQFSLSIEKELYKKLDDIVALGGEGLMLHHKHAMYKLGRNKALLKLKPYQDDEAIVLKHIQGKGKYQRMMGSLMVENEEGIIFYIGTGFTDQQRQHPPKIGDVVTYRYRGLTRHGVPKHASFLRLRHDSDL